MAPINRQETTKRRIIAGVSGLASAGLAQLYKRRVTAPPKKAVPALRKYMRKPMRTYKKKSNLSKRVNSLERSQRDTMSKVIYKYDSKDTIRPSVGSASYGYRDAVGVAAMDLAIAQCRYFDPANPATLITGSLATPTYKQNILISCSSQMVITNNYQVPAVVTYGVAFNKQDTSITPNAAFSNGLSDVGSPDSSSTMLSFKDSPQFRDLWRVKLKSKRLMPGKSIVIKHFQKGFTYDPSLVDSHNQTYQKKFKSAVYVYRCQGVLGHDSSVSTEQGMLAAGIDCYISSRYIVTYDSGGASVRTIVLNETASQSFTNGGVVSSMPVADNLGYSVS